MIRVYVKKQSSYPVSTPGLKKRLRDFLGKRGIVSDAEVSVAIVGEKKMLDLSKKYLKDNKIHDVLSFSAEELKGQPTGAGRPAQPGEFTYPPDGRIQLGEIVICYPLAVEEAKAEGKRIEEKVTELVEHGALHLMGEHHE